MDKLEDQCADGICPIDIIPTNSSVPPIVRDTNNPQNAITMNRNLLIAINTNHAEYQKNLNHLRSLNISSYSGPDDISVQLAEAKAASNIRFELYDVGDPIDIQNANLLGKYTQLIPINDLSGYIIYLVDSRISSIDINTGNNPKVPSTDIINLKPVIDPRLLAAALLAGVGLVASFYLFPIIASSVALVNSARK